MPGRELDRDKRHRTCQDDDKPALRRQPHAARRDREPRGHRASTQRYHCELALDMAEHDDRSRAIGEHGAATDRFVELCGAAQRNQQLLPRRDRDQRAYAMDVDGGAPG